MCISACSSSIPEPSTVDTANSATGSSSSVPSNASDSAAEQAELLRAELIDTEWKVVEFINFPSGWTDDDDGRIRFLVGPNGVDGFSAFVGCAVSTRPILWTPGGIDIPQPHPSGEVWDDPAMECRDTNHENRLPAFAQSGGSIAIQINGDTLRADRSGPVGDGQSIVARRVP